MIALGFTDAVAPWPAEADAIRLWDIGVAWRHIHLAPGVYDWTRLDLLVAKAAGRHLTYVVGATPRWLAKYPDQPHAAPWLGPGSNSMPFDIDLFNQFIYYLATRYAGRINAYEIWNEPQLADFLFPYTVAECNTLALMTKRAHRTIKAVYPAALVLAASVLPRPSSGGMKRSLKYLRALKRKGFPVDVLTCHIYPEVGKGVKRWVEMLKDVTDTLAAIGAPSDLWITESAYGLLGPPIQGAKARRLVEGTYARYGGAYLSWYAWRRPDLGGMLIDDTPGKDAAWQAIKGANGA